MPGTLPWGTIAAQSVILCILALSLWQSYRVNIKEISLAADLSVASLWRTAQPWAWTCTFFFTIFGQSSFLCEFFIRNINHQSILTKKYFIHKSTAIKACMTKACGIPIKLLLDYGRSKANPQGSYKWDSYRNGESSVVTYLSPQ